MKKTIAIIVGVIVCLCVGAFARYGGFVCVEVQESTQGGEMVVYKTVWGNYSQTPQVMEEVYKYLKVQGIETFKWVWIYFDDPETTAESDLVAEVGCIIEPQDRERVQEMELGEYAVKVLEEKEYMVITFPYKWMPAIFIGMRKAYPALEKYAQEHNYKGITTLEIYDVPGQKLHYWQEIVREEEGQAEGLAQE